MPDTFDPELQRRYEKYLKDGTLARNPEKRKMADDMLARGIVRKPSEPVKSPKRQIDTPLPSFIDTSLEGNVSSAQRANPVSGRLTNVPKTPGTRPQIDPVAQTKKRVIVPQDAFTQTVVGGRKPIVKSKAKPGQKTPAEILAILRRAESLNPQGVPADGRTMQGPRSPEAKVSDTKFDLDTLAALKGGFLDPTFAVTDLVGAPFLRKEDAKKFLSDEWGRGSGGGALARAFTDELPAQLGGGVVGGGVTAAGLAWLPGPAKLAAPFLGMSAQILGAGKIAEGRDAAIDLWLRDPELVKLYRDQMTSDANEFPRPSMGGRLLSAGAMNKPLNGEQLGAIGLGIKNFGRVGQLAPEAAQAAQTGQKQLAQTLGSGAFQMALNGWGQYNQQQQANGGEPVSFSEFIQNYDQLAGISELGAGLAFSGDPTRAGEFAHNAVPNTVKGAGRAGSVGRAFGEGFVQSGGSTKVAAAAARASAILDSVLAKGTGEGVNFSRPGFVERRSAGRPARAIPSQSPLPFQTPGSVPEGPRMSRYITADQAAGNVGNVGGMRPGEGVNASMGFKPVSRPAKPKVRPAANAKTPAVPSFLDPQGRVVTDASPRPSYASGTSVGRPAGITESVPGRVTPEPLPDAGTFSRVNIRDREAAKKALVDTMDYTPEQADALSSEWESLARGWAKQTGRTTGEWYDTYAGRMTKGGATLARELGGVGTERAAVLRVGDYNGKPEDTRRVIVALASPDPSSGIHETGHIFLDMLHDAGDTEGLRAVSEWAGGEVKKGARDTRTQERFATAFEDYTRTGKAPNPSLQNVFEKFKGFLSEVYNKVIVPGVQLLRRGKGGKSDSGRTQDTLAVNYRNEDGTAVQENVLPFSQEIIDLVARYHGDISEPAKGTGKRAGSTNGTQRQSKPVRPAAPTRGATGGTISEGAGATGGQTSLATNFDTPARPSLGGSSASAGQSVSSVATAEAKRETSTSPVARQTVEGQTAKPSRAPIVGKGQEETVYTPSSNRPVKVRYAVVEADSLIPSQRDSFAANPDYDPALQPRDRTRAEMQAQVDGVARSLVPERLQGSATSADGAPIVGSDGQVESGNGRTLGIRRAYELYPDSANSYRAHLEKNAARFGYTPDEIAGMKRPVLVRVREDGDVPLSSSERSKLAAEMGENPIAAMGETEKARQDGKRLVESDIVTKISPSSDGNLNTAANAEAIRKWLATVPQSERSSLISGNGQTLTQEGVDRFRNAVLAAAYDDPLAVAKIVESPDEQAKRVSDAMMNTAPRFANLKRNIGKGEAHPVDITTDIADAAKTLMYLRKNGIGVEEHVKQLGMFDDGMTPEATAILRAFDEFKASGKKTTDFLNTFVTLSERAGNPKQAGMVETTPPTKLSLIEAARRQVAGEPSEQSALFDFEEPKAPAQEVKPPVEEKPATEPKPTPDPYAIDQSTEPSDVNYGPEQSDLNTRRPIEDAVSDALKAAGKDPDAVPDELRALVKKSVEWGRKRVEDAAKSWWQYKLLSYDEGSGTATLAGNQERTGWEGATHTYKVTNSDGKSQEITVPVYTVNVKTGLGNDPDSTQHLNGRAVAGNARSRDGINVQLKAAGIPSRVVSKHVEIARRLVEEKTGARPEPLGDILFQGRKGKNNPSFVNSSGFVPLSQDSYSVPSGYKPQPATEPKPAGQTGQVPPRPSLTSPTRPIRPTRPSARPSTEPVVPQVPRRPRYAPVKKVAPGKTALSVTPASQARPTRATTPKVSTGTPTVPTVPERTGWQKALHLAADLADIPKAIKLTGDLGVIARQGLILGVNNPKAALFALGDMARSAKSEGQKKVYDGIKADHLFDKSQEAGLYLSEIAREKGTADEQFSTKVLDAIPGLNKISGATERMNIGYLDSLRYSLFKGMSGAVIEKGAKRVAKGKAFDEAEELKTIARWVNYASGRGDTVNMGEDWNRLITAGFLSPRYVASRFQAIADPRLYFNAKAPEARKQILLNNVRYAGAVITALKVAQMAGAQVDLDEESPTFGQAKFGNRSYEISGGVMGNVRFVLRMVKALRTGEGNPKEIADSWLRGKLSPVAGVVSDELIAPQLAYDRFNDPVAAKRATLARNANRPKKATPTTAKAILKDILSGKESTEVTPGERAGLAARRVGGLFIPGEIMVRDFASIARDELGIDPNLKGMEGAKALGKGLASSSLKQKASIARDVGYTYIGGGVRVIEPKQSKGKAKTPKEIVKEILKNARGG